MFQIKAILNVFNVFGVPPALDETAQRELLQEVLPLFTEEDNKMLDAQPNKEETKERLWKTNSNSSPGSDGLTYLVYKECWDILGDSITDVMICLHNGEPETPTQRLSLMVFAPKPKKLNSIKYKDKRTLSLINCDKKLYELIPTYRLKIISPRILSPNQLATGGDKKIYHGVNSARDAIQVTSNKNMSGAIVDVDLVAGFNLVSIFWIAMVMLAKGMSERNVQRFKNMYRDAEIRVVVNGVVGGAIKVKRCVRQGAPSSMLSFLYNMDPVILYLEKRLKGLDLYRMPIQGPVMEDEEQLEDDLDNYSVKGYADDLKAYIKTLDEFVLLDNALSLLEASSGCQVHRDINQDKCKVLLLGNWRRLTQADIPVPYLKISSFLDMLGLTLMATYTKTRKANGDVLDSKVKNIIGTWRVGRFMPMTERSWSINMYALSKVWYRTHCVDLRQIDINNINKYVNQYLFADQLEKPMEIVRYRQKKCGGLNLFHVKSKATATLIKSLIETGMNPKYIQSAYHRALLSWNVEEDRLIPNPGNNPYYTTETYNIIRSAMREGNDLVSMTGKDWYNYILSSVIGKEDELTPCRAEIIHPLHDWTRAWALARMNGLSSLSMTFLFQLLHQILPCRERLARILPRVETSQCKVCDTRENDSLFHGFVQCSGSRECFNWMMLGLNKFCDNLTPEKLLILDVKLAVPLPFEELAPVWFSSEVMRRMFAYRKEDKRCRLYEIRAEMEAEINLVRHSKYADMAVILDLMMD